MGLNHLSKLWIVKKMYRRNGLKKVVGRKQIRVRDYHAQQRNENGGTKNRIAQNNKVNVQAIIPRYKLRRKK